MTSRKPLKGVFPILNSTFHDDGSLDLESQQSLVRHLESQGAHGLGLFGNASEGYSLSDAERGTLLKLVRAITKLPLVASTGHSGTQLAVEASRKAQDLGADALMVLPPSFMKTDADGLMFYYDAISKAVEIPIMVQDAPLMTQVVMPAALLSRMGREIEHVVYAKVEAPPTSPKIAAVAAAGSITAFGGLNGNFLIEEFHRGALGMMPGSDMIDSFVAIWNALEAADDPTAWTIFSRILPLIRFELQPGWGVSAMKHNLKAAGVIKSSFVRHPTGAVDPQGLAELDFLRSLDRPGMKLKHVRWYIAALLFLASIINYIDRQTLSVVAPVLTKELNLSPIQYSNILQAFLVTYTLMYLGSGFLVDRWGTRWSLAAFMAFWSLSNMLHAFARSAFQLGLFRAMLGLGEPGNFMAGFKAISEWYPPKEKGFVNALQNAGAAVGAIIAAPFVVWLMVKFDWRTCFVVTGALGFVWLLAWIPLYRLPANHPWITPEELALVREGNRQSPQNNHAVSRLELLKQRRTWGLLASRFISDPVWWFYLFWLPKYLVEQRHFTMMQMGLLAWLPYLTADLGSFAGGLGSGWLVKRGWPPLNARKVMLLPCALLMPLSVLVPYSSATMAMVIISLVTFAHMAWKTNLMTITNDIYPVGLVGSVSGIIAFGSGVGGTLFTNLTGQVVEHYSYTAIFIIMGFMHPAAYLIVRLLVKSTPSPGAVGTTYEAPFNTSGAAR